jgi:DNA adenine methylase
VNYQGGKSSLAKQIGAFMQARYQPGANYYEPFIGAGNVLARTGFVTGQRFASDVHTDLIMMYCAIKSGWVPPSEVTKAEYQALQYSEPSALRGFVGFGSSWGGKWFGGYAGARTTTGTGRISAGNTDKVYTFASSAKNGLMRMLPIIQATDFQTISYADVRPAPGSLVYCDPPYKDTTMYLAGDFDHDRFWSVIREWSKLCTVVVSEAQAPSDFEPVLQLTMRRHTGLYDTQHRNEFLFMVKQ